MSIFKDTDRRFRIHELPDQADMAPTIWLVCIAKNEADSHEGHCILRMLESCKSLIAGVVCVGTFAPVGEGTLLSQASNQGPVLEMVQQWATQNGKQWATDHRQWRGDFSDARNHALQLAHESMADWLLLLDCDEEYVPGQQVGFQSGMFNVHDVNAFVLPTLHNGQVITRINLIRNGLGWSYVGKIHEDLLLNGEHPTAEFYGSMNSPQAGPHVVSHYDGARSQDPLKARKDIDTMLTAYMESRNTNHRMLFYAGLTMAQSGDSDAFKTLHLLINNHEEELTTGVRYIAHLTMGRECLKKSLAHAAQWHLEQAHAVLPRRPEALCELALMHGNDGEWHLARLYALAAVMNEPPDNLDFYEPHWLSWRALDLLCVSLINSRYFSVAVPFLQTMAVNSNIPPGERERVNGYIQAVLGPATPGQRVAQDEVEAMLRMAEGK